MEEKSANGTRGKVKGGIAEALIQRLFIKSYFDIYRCGKECFRPETEFSMPGMTVTTKAEVVCGFPDFIVRDRKAGTQWLIEVKYRNSGIVQWRDYAIVKNLCRFPDAKLIIVNAHEKPFFRVCDAPYIENDEFKGQDIRHDVWWIKDATLEECEAELKHLAPYLSLK